ncbi:MAG TPA: hypothetical protein VKU91_01190 [Acidimicrobiales bacterium]|nr:hypothetical protein [Acidimicrobiales bacterium]
MRALAAVACRPRLWATAVRVGATMVPPRWWRRWPPLPVPPPAYMRFRREAMYGDGEAPVGGDDLVAYLEWCRRLRAGAM